MRNLKHWSLFVFFLVLAFERIFIKIHSIKNRCYRIGKYTVCRRDRASFSLEILRAGTVKGLMRESLWWWQCSVRYRLRLPPTYGILLPPVPLRRQLSIKRVNPTKQPRYRGRNSPQGNVTIRAILPRRRVRKGSSSWHWYGPCLSFNRQMTSIVSRVLTTLRASLFGTFLQALKEGCRKPVLGAGLTPSLFYPAI